MPEETAHLKLIDHAKHDADDKQVQELTSAAILKAADDGKLVGVEAPVWLTHTLPHNGAYEQVANVIERQLNHLAGHFGVLGFSVQYKKGSIDNSNPTKGYFLIRAYAEQNAPIEEEVAA